MFRHPPMAHDVFISYSHRDKSVADAACAILEKRGVRCWIAPRDVTPGKDWGGEIVEAIGASSVLVLIYSASANESHQIRREVERAVSKGLPVLPVRIEDAPLSKSLEYFISSQHWLDAMTTPLEQHLEQLAHTVRLLVPRFQPPLGPQPKPGEADPAPPSSQIQSSPPRPREPGSRRGVTLAAGGAVLLALALGGYAMLGRGGSSTVDRALVGGWTASAPEPAGLRLSALSVDRDGSYRLQVSVRDSGTINASGGRYQMVNAARIPISGSYSDLGAGSVSITGPLGTAVWSRKPGGSPSGGSSLAGDWELSPVIEGVTWKMSFEIPGNGRYRLVSETEDSGRLTAAGGSWTMTSSSGRSANGTYQVLNSGSFSMQGPTGPTIWRRR
ncbi:MAG: toll/interleukin-1 receptor domain-containing protein [Gemmatimonadales bacterium]